MAYYQQVFDAKAETAELAVSDWASPQDPGGPAGQVLIFSFIEVKPYFNE